MTETIEACPECDSPSIVVNSSGSMKSGDRATYTCSDCRALFDEPETRQRKRTGSNLRGAAKKLLEADPEDWP